MTLCRLVLVALGLLAVTAAAAAGLVSVSTGAAAWGQAYNWKPVAIRGGGFAIDSMLQFS
jgi:hypothetical protein